MRAALTNLISLGVDRSRVATVLEVMRSKDALWIATPILFLTLRG
jgi:hypothetical protein